jgi:hypothetical protein
LILQLHVCWSYKMACVVLCRVIMSSSPCSSSSSKEISSRLEWRKSVKVSEPLCIPVQKPQLIAERWPWVSWHV